MAGRGHQYVDGSFRTGTSGSTHDVVNPATGAVLATTDLAGPQDVDAAVAAAGRAQAEWGRATPGERAAALNALAAAMGERAEEYAQVETAQAGKPIKLTREFDVPGSIDNVSFYAGAARNLEGRAVGRVRRRPHLGRPS